MQRIQGPSGDDMMTCPPLTELPFPCASIPMWGNAVFVSLLNRVELGSPRLTLLSTNASCQPEKPENSQVEMWGSASTLGLNSHPRDSSLPTGESTKRVRNLRNVG